MHEIRVVPATNEPGQWMIGNDPIRHHQGFNLPVRELTGDGLKLTRHNKSQSVLKKGFYIQWINTLFNCDDWANVLISREKGRYVYSIYFQTLKNNLNIFLETLDIYGVHGVYLHNNSARRPGSHRAWGIWKP